MGLFLSSKLVEGFGGKIWLDSEEGKGSSFWLKFVFEKANHQTPEIRRRKSQEGLQMQDMSLKTSRKSSVQEERKKFLISPSSPSVFQFFSDIKEDNEDVDVNKKQTIPKLIRLYKTRILVVSSSHFFSYVKKILSPTCCELVFCNNWREGLHIIHKVFRLPKTGKNIFIFIIIFIFLSILSILFFYFFFIFFFFVFYFSFFYFIYFIKLCFF